MVQTVLLLGKDNWFLSEAMCSKLEGVHVVFLSQIIGKREVQREDRTWGKVAAEKVPKKAGTDPLGIYIDRRQEKVTEWVALHQILEVCDREKGY